MSTTELINSRWRLSDYVFFNFVNEVEVSIDIGPFPDGIDDAQAKTAYDYLRASCPAFLTLGDREWTLNVTTLAEQFPQLGDQLQGLAATHPAEFEYENTSALQPELYMTRYSGRGAPIEYFLRITFNYETFTQKQPVVEIPDNLFTPESALEPASVLPKPNDDSALKCFYSGLSLSACLEALKPFARQEKNRSIIETPSPSQPLEFEVTSNSNAFSVRTTILRRASHLYGCYSAVLRSESDGGTTILGKYSVVSTDTLRSMMPYLGLLAGIAGGLISFQNLQTLPTSSTSSVKFWGFCFALSLGWLFGFVRLLMKDGKTRQAVYEEDKESVIGFVQITLKAEAVEP